MNNLLETYLNYIFESNQPVQLGVDTHYLDTNDLKELLKKDTWYAEHKIDGIRIILKIKSKTEYEAYTRNGKNITEKFKLLFPDLNKLISKALKVQPDGIVLDGEFYYKSIFQTQSVLFTRKNFKPPKEKYYWFIFDVIPLKDWNHRKCNLTYKERRKLLDKILPQSFNGFRKLEHYKITSLKDMKQTMHQAVKKGYEGLMLKAENSLYKFRRTKDWIKVKPFKSEEFKCIGMEEGTGKNKGKLGAIVIDYKGNKVKVGSGFSDEQRDYFWKNKDKIVGKCVEVMYFEKTKQSLRFPRFVKVREDKARC